MTVPAVSASEYTYGSFGGEPIVSAESALQTFAENGWSAATFAGRANSWTTAIGQDPGVGYILMARDRIDALDTAAAHTLVLGSGSSDESIEINGLYIRFANKISPSASLSAQSLYLVELTDTRYHLARKPVNKRYNCRYLRRTTDIYVTETTNSGTPWTWEGVLQDLWAENIAALIGAYETQPTTPVAFNLDDMTSVPENLRYEGVSAWSALNDACRRCGCTVIYDQVFVNNFFIARLGRMKNDGVSAGAENEDAPAYFDEGGADSLAGNRYSAAKVTRPVGGGDALIFDEECLQSDAIVPESVTIAFPTEYGASQINDELTGNYGKWYTVAIDATDGVSLPNSSIAADWFADPSDSTGTDTGRMERPTFAVAGSEMIRYDLATARFSSATATDPDNLTALVARAKEAARDVYRTLRDMAKMHMGYAGIKFWSVDSNPVNIGKTISAVTWSDTGDGLRTDLYRSPPDLLPVFPPSLSQPGGGGGGSQVIQFITDTVDCDAHTAVGIVTDVQCSGADVEVGDYVNLTDPLGFLIGNPAMLVNHTGFAVRMSTDDPEDLYGTCSWAINAMDDLGYSC